MIHRTGFLWAEIWKGILNSKAHLLSCSHNILHAGKCETKTMNSARTYWKKRKFFSLFLTRLCPWNWIKVNKTDMKLNRDYHQWSCQKSFPKQSNVQVFVRQEMHNQWSPLILKSQLKIWMYTITMCMFVTKKVCKQSLNSIWWEYSVSTDSDTVKLFHIFMYNVQENPNVKVFAMARQPKQHTRHYNVRTDILNFTSWCESLMVLFTVSIPKNKLGAPCKEHECGVRTCMRTHMCQTIHIYGILIININKDRLIDTCLTQTQTDTRLTHIGIFRVTDRCSRHRRTHSKSNRLMNKCYFIFRTNSNLSSARLLMLYRFTFSCVALIWPSRLTGHYKTIIYLLFVVPVWKTFTSVQHLSPPVHLHH